METEQDIDLLTWQSIRPYQTICYVKKSPGAICSNDAKSCYDLIIHTPASLAMQLQDVPESAVTCLFNTLQELSHQVHTACGDSDQSYDGKSIIPLHGVCQGYGAGPAIWAVVSTPILNMQHSADLGSFFETPISHTKIRLMGYSLLMILT